jgi:glutathionyl-hydroquinone reductase
MFNDAFDDFIPSKKGVTYYPENLRAQIDEINDWVYNTVNNGVYKCGFATTQEACK